jgi:signal transduction histidine kinase
MVLMKQLVIFKELATQLKGLSLFLFLFSIFLEAGINRTIEIDEDFLEQTSSNYLFYINNNLRLFSPEEIYKSDKLQVAPETYLGITNELFWTRMKLKNISKTQKLLTIYNPTSQMDLIDVYIFRNGNFSEVHSLGSSKIDKNSEGSRHSNLHLALEVNEEITVVAKVQNQFMFDIGWTVMDTNVYMQSEREKSLFFGFVLGVALISIIVNILNYFKTKDKDFILHGILIFVLTLYIMNFQGYTHALNIKQFETQNFFSWEASLIAFLIALFYHYYIFRDLHKKYFKTFNSLKITIFISITLTVFAIFIIIVGFMQNLEIYQYVLPLGLILYILFIFLAHRLLAKFKLKKVQDRNDILLRQSHFTSMGQAIGNITHQWKDPLTVFGSSITLLETIYLHRQDRFHENFEKQLPKMKQSVEFLKKTLFEFDNYYSKDIDNSPFLLNDSIEKSVDILQSRMTLTRTKFSVNMQQIYIGHSFENIFSNILMIFINNSIDEFSKQKKEDNTITVNINTSKKHLYFEYKDNAGGIKLKPIEKVFDQFTTTKGTQGSGLAIVKMLVEDKMNGVIDVENTKDGVSFKLKIPKDIIFCTS